MCIAKKTKPGSVLKKKDPPPPPADPVEAPEPVEASAKPKSEKMSSKLLTQKSPPKVESSAKSVKTTKESERKVEMSAKPKSEKITVSKILAAQRSPPKVESSPKSESIKAPKRHYYYSKRSDTEDEECEVEPEKKNMTRLERKMHRELLKRKAQTAVRPFDQPEEKFDYYDMEVKDNRKGEDIWNNMKATKKRIVENYKVMCALPPGYGERDRLIDVHSLIVDETQKSVIEELDWVDRKYRDTARPFWVMDDRQDEMAFTWLRIMSREVNVWKAKFEELQKWKPVGVTFDASDRNEGMNRDGGVKCQDKGRIILRSPGLPTNYIHANYIGIPLNPKRFICTQTPMKSTMHAFWAMVVQEKVRQIVVRDEYVLCFVQYWPLEKNEKMEFGEGEHKIVVKNMDVHLRPMDFYEYKLKLSWGKGQERTVSVYQHERWNTDHPWLNRELLPIIWNNKYPVVVHDSTGVEYSGELIVAALIHEKMVDGDDCLNPEEIIKDLRKQRFGLLNTFRSYWSMYRTIRELLENRCQYNPGFDPKFVSRGVMARVRREYDEMDEEEDIYTKTKRTCD